MCTSSNGREFRRRVVHRARWRTGVGQPYKIVTDIQRYLLLRFVISGALIAPQKRSAGLTINGMPTNQPRGDVSDVSRNRFGAMAYFPTCGLPVPP